MRPDTLTYHYLYQASPAKMYQTLLEQQLKYFQAHDPKIIHLHVGDKIRTTLKTKLNKLDSTTTMKITQIVPGKIFQMQTMQPGDHTITQTFKFGKNQNGKNMLTYSEQTDIHTVHGQNYFFFTILLYKFFYNRGMKKRMQYLDHLALN